MLMNKNWDILTQLSKDTVKLFTSGFGINRKFYFCSFRWNWKPIIVYGWHNTWSKLGAWYIMSGLIGLVDSKVFGVSDMQPY